MPKFSQGANKNKVTNMPVTANVCVDKGFMGLGVKGSGVGGCAQDKQVELVGFKSKADNKQAGNGKL